MSLNLGPFRASVDRVGVLLDSGRIPEDDFAAIAKAIDFKPPSGIGLVVDAELVKGGGYLYIDRERGEYAGVLELEMKLPIVGQISLKAIGLLTTKLPEGRDGWALLLLIYAQFRVQLGYGFTFSGLGGIIGLHHAPDQLALSDGLRTRPHGRPAVPGEPRRRCAADHPAAAGGVPDRDGHADDRAGDRARLGNADARLAQGRPAVRA